MLPETPALKGPSNEPTTGKGVGNCPRDVTKRRHWTSETSNHSNIQTSGNTTGSSRERYVSLSQGGCGGMCVFVPRAQRLQLLHVCTGVSGVVHQHRAIAQTSIHIVTVVQRPAATPHRFTCVVGLNHCVGQQTVTQTSQYYHRL